MVERVVESSVKIVIGFCRCYRVWVLIFRVLVNSRKERIFWNMNLLNWILCISFIVFCVKGILSVVSIISSRLIRRFFIVILMVVGR